MRERLRTYANENTLIALIVLLSLIAYGLAQGPFLIKLTYLILLAVTIIGALPIVFRIGHSIIKGGFGVDFIAIAAIISTLSLHETVAAGIILLMLSGGESLEQFAQGQAHRSLEKLIRQAPSTAHRIAALGIEDVLVSEVNLQDLLVVKAHEIIPVDGKIIEGSSSVDEASITGEPLPRTVGLNDQVWGGTVNEGGIITIQAESTFEQSVFSGIVRLVKEAESEKAPFVRMADRYSVVFTIFTFVVAGLAALYKPLLGAAVLVVATPCPLILAAPIAFISGMSRSARKGIIVKHGGVFEAMVSVRAFFFDKTGTLTFGIPSIKTIDIFSKTHTQRDLLRIAASIEQYSTHILAHSVIAAAKKERLELDQPTDIQEITGKGVTGTIKDNVYVVGKSSFVQPENHVVSRDTAVFISENNIVIGAIRFADTVRDNTAHVIRDIEWANEGNETILVTGDTDARAEEVGKMLGFTDIHANCLPQEKIDLVRAYEAQGKRVAMIGDGVNDAPALAAATVGMALGSRGATVATDVADAVIVEDDIGKVTDLMNISRRTLTIAEESIFIGIGLSVAAMIAAAFGYLPPVYGALLQEGIDVLVILNALRALR